jgi:hypothetical protein
VACIPLGFLKPHPTSFPMTRCILSLILLASVFALHVRVAQSQTPPEEESHEHRLRRIKERHERAMRGLNELHEHNMRMLRSFADRTTPDTRDLEMEKQSHMRAYDDLRGKMGFMRYCRERNLLDQETASKAGDIYSRYIAYTFYDPGTSHQSYNRESGDEAERQGSLGIIYFRDWLQMYLDAEPRIHPHGKSLDEYAALKAATPASVCRQWADEASGSEYALSVSEMSDEAKRKIDAARKALKPSDTP